MLGAILLGLSAIGTAISATGQWKAGTAQKELGEFNARVAAMRAEDAIARGQEEEDRFRQSVEVLIGSQRAGFASQNVDVGIGSPIDVVADAAFLGELDALQIRTNARREAWGYKVDAENYRRGGQIAQSAERYGAVATGISGAGSLLRDIYLWKMG